MPCVQRLRQYIGSDENRLVQLAVDGLLGGTPRYNPLVFTGPSGTGKSLLANGLAERWRYEHPHDVVLTTCGSDFARSFAYALDTDSLVEWRARSCAARLFVLDDLQQLQAKVAAQEELARLLDQLLDSSCTVLITVLHFTGGGDGLLPSLSSRLSAGLVVPLLAPGLPARRELLRQTAEFHEIPLSDAAIELLATGPSDAASDRLTVPQLSHALLQLNHAACTDGIPIAPDAIRAFWKGQALQGQVTLRTIASRVARYFSLPLAQLRGPSRRSCVVRARGVAMLLARNLTGTSFELIGKFFGGRDHTTVLHACRKTESLRGADPQIAEAVDALLEQLHTPLSTS